MTIYKQPGSPYYYYDFYFENQRYQYASENGVPLNYGRASQSLEQNYLLSKFSGDQYYDWNCALDK